jgi:hypothetical protein
MTRRRLTPQRALRLFADAFAAFADDPGPENLERYLAASRLLEEAQARARIAGKGADAA